MDKDKQLGIPVLGKGLVLAIGTETRLYTGWNDLAPSWHRGCFLIARGVEDLEKRIRCGVEAVEQRRDHLVHHFFGMTRCCCLFSGRFHPGLFRVKTILIRLCRIKVDSSHGMDKDYHFNRLALR